MPSSVDLICVNPDSVGAIWEQHLAPELRRAIERTGLGLFADLERECLAGNGQVWIVWSTEIEAVVATALHPTEMGLVCTITAIGGVTKMDRWLHLIEKIEQYAKAEGCKRVRIIGRKGWLRALKGYRASYAIIDKELT